MTEIELYKFIRDNDIEWHWRDNDGQEDVYILPFYFNLPDLIEILGGTILTNEGIECRLRDGYFAIWMNDICEYFGIDIFQVFPKEEES